MATTKINPMASRLQSHAESASRAFAKHKLTVQLEVGMFRAYRCAIPGECQYAFNVTTIPGRIIVTGDVGELIVERCEDMLAWSRGAINSVDYFQEKVPRSVVSQEYDPDLVREWVADVLEEDAKADDDYKLTRDQREALDEILSNLDDHGRDEICRVIYDNELPGYDDMPDFMNYTSNFLWCREAIKCCLRLLDERTKGTP